MKVSPDGSGASDSVRDCASARARARAQALAFKVFVSPLPVSAKSSNKFFCIR